MYGRKWQFNDEPMGESTPRKTTHPLLDCNRVPRVVLRRLSCSSIEATPQGKNARVLLTRRLRTPSREDVEREIDYNATPRSSKQTRDSKYRRF